MSDNNDARAPLARLRGEFIEDADQQRRLFKDVDEMQAMINTAPAFFRDDARLEQATQLDLAELLQPLIDDYRDQAIDITFHGPPRPVATGPIVASGLATGSQGVLEGFCLKRSDR